MSEEAWGPCAWLGAGPERADRSVAQGRNEANAIGGPSEGRTRRWKRTGISPGSRVGLKPILKGLGAFPPFPPPAVPQRPPNTCVPQFSSPTLLLLGFLVKESVLLGHASALSPAGARVRRSADTGAQGRREEQPFWWLPGRRRQMEKSREVSLQPPSRLRETHLVSFHSRFLSSTENYCL